MFSYFVWWGWVAKKRPFPPRPFLRGQQTAVSAPAATATVDGSSAAGLLATAAQRTLALQTIQWTTHITGSQNGALVEETETTCALRLGSEEAHCTTRVLTNAAEAPLLELVQIGAEQWGRQGDTSWQPVGGTAPASIILHELVRVQNGRLLFFANQYVRSAAIVGQEELGGQTMSVVAVEFDTQAYNLFETWYGAGISPSRPIAKPYPAGCGWGKQMASFTPAPPSSTPASATKPSP
ncbi:MAG: hypothetical protein IPL28_24115 [Chloroflexi bacterium]|nr:hypothetical protein [Chloroflexota bacterium]